MIWKVQERQRKSEVRLSSERAGGLLLSAISLGDKTTPCAYGCVSREGVFSRCCLSGHKQPCQWEDLRKVIGLRAPLHRCDCSLPRMTVSFLLGRGLLLIQILCIPLVTNENKTKQNKLHVSSFPGEISPATLKHCCINDIRLLATRRI